MILAAIAALGLVGCGPQAELKPDISAKSSEFNTPESGSPIPQSPAEPPAAAGQSDKEGRATLAKLEKTRSMTSRALIAMPKDEKFREAYVSATNALAFQWMSMDSVPAREKYRKALKLYRETLKVDPSNAEATKWIQTIEGIYKQMGRPIPKV